MNWSGLIPKTIEKQIIVVLLFSYVVLLGLMTLFEWQEVESINNWAENDHTIERLSSIATLLPKLKEEEKVGYIASISRCHAGYQLSDAPGHFERTNEDSRIITERLSQRLSQGSNRVQAGFKSLTQGDFSYAQCAAGEMSFPITALVISIQIDGNEWLLAEVHAHEWHLTSEMEAWLLRTAITFSLIGAITLLFVRRISKSLNAISSAARKFSKGLQVEAVADSKLPDVQEAIRDFNVMQQEIHDKIVSLAALSHDLRSPLTALRLKAELVADETSREDLLSSIRKMEQITQSALEFLKGQSRDEPMQPVELSSLVSSECADFIEQGANVTCKFDRPVAFSARPNALARALRNLIENAIKYAGSAEVSFEARADVVIISVSDHGPGIPEGRWTESLQPFTRLSTARESEKGGLGLGLTIAAAIAAGHDGRLVLAANSPTGLVVQIVLPFVKGA